LRGSSGRRKEKKETEDSNVHVGNSMKKWRFKKKRDGQGNTLRRRSNKENVPIEWLILVSQSGSEEALRGRGGDRPN